MDESNFFSLDKLVEFGCGMAVATQMANSMNASLNQMQTPGVDYPMPKDPTSTIYYVVLDNKATGPFTLAELSKLISEKKVTGQTYVWKPGMTTWELAQNNTDVLKLVALTPPPIPETQNEL